MRGSATDPYIYYIYYIFVVIVVIVANGLKALILQGVQSATIFKNVVAGCSNPVVPRVSGFFTPQCTIFDLLGLSLDQ